MTREAWLTQAADALRPSFAAAGAPLPEKLRLSIGFPSRRALASKNPRIGECWQQHTSEDLVHQIFISPLLNDPEEILSVLAHELAHAALPKGTEHKPPFVRLVRALGLEGKPTATYAGPAFRALAAPILAALGPLPHARLTPTADAKPKQTTRLLKAMCPLCGYTVRVTKKWVDAAGLPSCPTAAHGPFELEES